MVSKTIELSDPSKLVEQSGGPDDLPGPLFLMSVESVALSDASCVGDWLRGERSVRLNMYGFYPIASGGSSVTSDAVDRMRQELGI